MTAALLQEAPDMLGDGDGITREEAAERLGVSLATLDRYLRRRLLTRYRSDITNRVEIDPDEVEHLRARRTPRKA
jgi:predicted site-specific integrase-resolvase